ncbi:MAG: hypothetical protein HY815_08425, partial [Candidatus Riflebacteria bacterium]|nr:hypothetical protein [Candidatus Riflebacteria bacterium]
MRWSKYNLLFEAGGIGWLLYNSLSNTLARVDDATLRALRAIRDDPGGHDLSDDPGFLLQLRQARVLVEDGEEESLLNVIRFRKRLANYDGFRLSLTVVPTLACNFRCRYCYELPRLRPGRMSREVEAALVGFVERHGPLRDMTVHWYGGEPLLCLDTIRRLTGSFLGMGPAFSADMVTHLSPQRQEHDGMQNAAADASGKLVGMRIFTANRSLGGNPLRERSS